MSLEALETIISDMEDATKQLGELTETLGPAVGEEIATGGVGGIVGLVGTIATHTGTLATIVKALISDGKGIVGAITGSGAAAPAVQAPPPAPAQAAVKAAPAVVPPPPAPAVVQAPAPPAPAPTAKETRLQKIAADAGLAVKDLASWM